MKQLLIIFLLFLSASAFGQTFTFECFCQSEMTGDSCDICPGTVITSRSFSGLLIYRNGVKYKWIDEPYMVRTRPGMNIEFLEQGPTPDKITIALAQTPYYTLQGFIDSTFCSCGDFRPLFYASDSTNYSPIYAGDTLQIVGWGATTVTFDSVLQKYIVYTPVSGGAGTVTDFIFTDGNGFDGTVTNSTTAPALSLETTVTGPIYGGGGDLLPITVGSGLTFSAPTLAAVDISATNELQTYSHSGTTSYINTLSNSGGSFTLNGGTGITLAHVAGTTTITNSSPLGTGTQNYLPKWATTTTLSSTSQVYDNGTGVGIGSTSPTEKLRVVSNDNTAASIIAAYANNLTAGVGIAYTGITALGSNTNIDYSLTSKGAGYVWLGQNSSGTGIRFTPSDGAFNNIWFGGVSAGITANSGQKLYLSQTSDQTKGLTVVTATGNTGINNTSPAQTFHVAGTARITGSDGTATTITGRDGDGDISNVGLGSGLSITSGTLNVSGFTPTAWINGGNSFGGTSVLGTNDNNALQFEVNGTTRGQFNTAGDFLINNSTAGNKLNVEGLGASGVNTRINGGALASGNTNLLIGGNATTTVYGIDENMTVTGASNNLLNRFRNGSTGSLINQLFVGSTAGGDPATQYNVETANSWIEGIDNSDTDRFKIQPYTQLGDGALGIQMELTGQIGIATAPAADLSMGFGLAKPLGLPSGVIADRAGSASIFSNTETGRVEDRADASVYKAIHSIAVPTLTAGVAIGTGGTMAVTLVAGNELAGRIRIRTGSTGLTTGIALTFTYPSSMLGNAYPVYVPNNNLFAAQMTNFYVSSTSSSAWQLSVNSTLAADTNYDFIYQVQQ